MLRRIVGTSIDERRFRRRESSEIRATLTNGLLPHRQWLAQHLLAIPDMKQILEIGCGWGANLEVLAKRDRSLKLAGVDINLPSIKKGQVRFMSLGLENIKLFEGRANNLEKFKDGSIDVVFTDAVLLYIGPDQIEGCIREMKRVARKAVVFLEMHQEGICIGGRYTRDGWVRDYGVLCRKVLSADVHIRPMPSEARPAGRWPVFGTLVEIRLDGQGLKKRSCDPGKLSEK